MPLPRDPHAQPHFWRDAALPFLEARWVEDGRRVCYAAHAHSCFSVGAVTAGRSTYLNGGERRVIAAGGVVAMNPQVVHACNPLDGEPWSYVMFYVDTAWLGALQRELGASPDGGFRPLPGTFSRDPALFAALMTLYATLRDAGRDPARKRAEARAFFMRLQGVLGASPAPADAPVADPLRRAMAFIEAHCTQPLRLEDICAEAGLSPSRLIRGFKRHYGLTPHAYLINRRIQRSQHWLRQGRDLAEVALEAGFADQAHFQRAFKRHLAATPGQYRD